MPLSNRLARRPHGFDTVRPQALWRVRESELLQEAVLQEDPTVYDIGIAREAQRLRHRAVFRPISIQRKAKVLRFRNEPPVSIKVRVEERCCAESWSSVPDGPRDLPPAA